MLLENISDKISGVKGENREQRNIIKAIGDKGNMIDKSITTLEQAKAQYEKLQITAKRLTNIDETLKKVNIN